jgi:hypothetical protein
MQHVVSGVVKNANTSIPMWTDTTLSSSAFNLFVYSQDAAGNAWVSVVKADGSGIAKTATASGAGVAMGATPRMELYFGGHTHQGEHVYIKAPYVVAGAMSDAALSQYAMDLNGASISYAPSMSRYAAAGNRTNPPWTTWTGTNTANVDDSVTNTGNSDKGLILGPYNPAFTVYMVCKWSSATYNVTSALLEWRLANTTGTTNLMDVYLDLAGAASSWNMYRSGGATAMASGYGTTFANSMGLSTNYRIISCACDGVSAVTFRVQELDGTVVWSATAPSITPLATIGTPNVVSSVSTYAGGATMSVKSIRYVPGAAMTAEQILADIKSNTLLDNAVIFSSCTATSTYDASTYLPEFAFNKNFGWNGEAYVSGNGATTATVTVNLKTPITLTKVRLYTLIGYQYSAVTITDASGTVLGTRTGLQASDYVDVDANKYVDVPVSTSTAYSTLKITPSNAGAPWINIIEAQFFGAIVVPAAAYSIADRTFDGTAATSYKLTAYPSIVNLIQSDTWSMSFLVKCTDQGRLFAVYKSGYGYPLIIEGYGLVLCNTPAGNFSITVPDFSPTKFTHVVVTVNAGVVTYYSNKVSRGSTSFASSFAGVEAGYMTVNGDAVGAAGPPGASFITGSMSRFRFYNSVLSTADINALYIEAFVVPEGSTYWRARPTGGWSSGDNNWSIWEMTMHSSTDGSGTTLTTGGTPLYSGLGGYSAGSLVDGNTDSRVILTSGGHYVGYQFASETVVKSMKIYSLGGSHCYSTGFVIEKSNDNSTWTGVGGTFGHNGSGWKTFAW